MTPVALVLPVLHPAGAERIVAELALRLPAHGFATSVICLEDERAAIGEELRAAGVPVTGLRLSRRRTLACAQALAEKDDAYEDVSASIDGIMRIASHKIIRR